MTHDYYHDTPAAMARVYREAAEIALLDPNFTEAEREKRAKYYQDEAAKQDAKAREGRA